MLSLGLLAGGIAVNVAMFQDGELKWFPPTHPIQRISDIMDDDFGSTLDEKVRVRVRAGVRVRVLALTPTLTLTLTPTPSNPHPTFSP